MKKITRSADDRLSAESHGMSVERSTCQKEKERQEPMANISPEDRQTLQTLFAKELQDEVTITYFTQRESVLIIPGHECLSLVGFSSSRLLSRMSFGLGCLLFG